MNGQVIAKILTLVQNRTLGTSTCTSGHNTYGTGTTLFGTSNTPRNRLEMVIFLPFFHIFPPKPTQSSIHTSKPLHIHLVTSILLKSSFNTYLSSKPFMNYSQNNSNMGHNPYTNQTQRFVRVCSNPNSFTLQLNLESNLKGRIPYS